MLEHADAPEPDIEAACWHGETVDTWRGRWQLPALRIFQRVGSTNDIARAMADAGAEQGTLVLADEQTRGRGRRGRAWSAPPESSLSMSMVVRPPTPGATRVLTLRLGLATARAIERCLSVPITIKWPNDLQAGGRKTAGILCEATVIEDRVAHVIAGLGINVRPPGLGWPAELAGRATSLEEAAADVNTQGAASVELLDSKPREPEPLGPEPLEPKPRDPELVGHVVAEWLAVARHPADALSPAEMRQFEARDALRGREVTVDDRPAGEAAGITDGGELLVHGDEGIRAIAAGTVRATERATGEGLTRGEHE